MVVSAEPPPMVDALRLVRRPSSGTRLWTCCAGRAGTCIRSEALHRVLTIGHLSRIARERVPTNAAKRDAAREGTIRRFRLRLAKCESFANGNPRGASPAVSAMMFQAV